MGATVQLDGSASADPDGDALSFQWTAVEDIVLSNATDARPRFTAAAVGTYRFTLVVNDGQLGSEADEVVITVFQPNRVPIADAGVDQSGETEDTFSLDGSGSRDSDGDALSYAWTEDTGNPASGLLSDAMAESPTLTPSIPGTYRFALVVNDGQVDSAPDEVVITVAETTAGADITVDIEDEE